MYNLLKDGTNKRKRKGRESEREREKELYFLIEVMLEIVVHYGLNQLLKAGTNASILKMVSMDMFYSKSHLPNVIGKATHLYT